MNELLVTFIAVTLLILLLASGIFLTLIISSKQRLRHEMIFEEEIRGRSAGTQSRLGRRARSFIQHEDKAALRCEESSKPRRWLVAVRHLFMVVNPCFYALKPNLHRQLGKPCQILTLQVLLFQRFALAASGRPLVRSMRYVLVLFADSAAYA